MPFATPPNSRIFGDGANEALSTQVATIDVEDNVATLTAISGIGGSAQQIFTFDELKAEITDAVNRLDTKPDKGFRLDIDNVVGNDNDGSEIVYLEDSQICTLQSPGHVAWNNLQPDTVRGLLLALNQL